MIQYKMAVISNITIEPFLKPEIERQFEKQSVQMNLDVIPYFEHQNQEYLNILSEVNTVLVWLNLEEMLSDITNAGREGDINKKIEYIKQLCIKLWNYLKQNEVTNTIWVLFEDYYSKLPIVLGSYIDLVADELNLMIVKELSEDVTFVDLKRIIADMGSKEAYQISNKVRWNFPYSKLFVQNIVSEIEKIYFIQKGVTKKCLVLDCDNVLWGGIISEDGKDAIILGNSGLGKEYQEFQRFVLSLYYHGVILAICSRNDEDEVLNIFREHSGMILHEEQIACFLVNWNNKPDNIMKLSELLNIGTESIVFIDDSIVEIESVRTILPDVTAILYDREKMYDKFVCFNLKNNFSRTELNKRNETYKTNVYRRNLKEQSIDYEDYIKSLQMNIDIHKCSVMEYTRIAELTQRANKCTNGKRYTVHEIRKRRTLDNLHLYAVCLADKYSDLGLVGVIEIEDNTLTLFCLSCRALGRRVENEMINFVKKFMINKIDFIDTSKNAYLKSLFIDSFMDIKI